MRLKISHTTVYTYDKPVHYALLQLRLTPRTADGQVVHGWSSTVTGGTHQLSFEDQYRNNVDLVMMENTDRLEILSQGEVEVEDRTGVIGTGRTLAPQWLFLQKTPVTTPGPHLRKLAKSVEATIDKDPLAGLHGLMDDVADAVQYTKGATSSVTSAEEALAAGRGVCQDHAHVMIATARLLDMPARYVSGYLMMDGVQQQEASHAWAEIWVPGLGWVGFDAANAMCPDDRYVRVALGRDYGEAAPVHGLRQGDAIEELCVSLQVQQ